MNKEGKKKKERNGGEKRKDLNLIQVAVLSVMKMETEVRAEMDGIIEKLCVAPGVVLKKAQPIIILKRLIPLFLFFPLLKKSSPLLLATFLLYFLLWNITTSNSHTKMCKEE